MWEVQCNKSGLPPASQSCCCFGLLLATHTTCVKPQGYWSCAAKLSITDNATEHPLHNHSQCVCVVVLQDTQEEQDSSIKENMPEDDNVLSQSMKGGSNSGALEVASEPAGVRPTQLYLRTLLPQGKSKGGRSRETLWGSS